MSMIKIHISPVKQSGLGLLFCDCLRKQVFNYGLYLVALFVCAQAGISHAQTNRGYRPNYGSAEQTARMYVEAYNNVLGVDPVLPTNALLEPVPAGGPADGYYARGGDAATYAAYYDNLTSIMLTTLSNENSITQNLYTDDPEVFSPGDLISLSLADQRNPLDANQIANLSAIQREDLIRDILDGIEIMRSLADKVIQLNIKTTGNNAGTGNEPEIAYDDAVGNLVELGWVTGPISGFSWIFDTSAGWWQIPTHWKPPFKVDLLESAIRADPVFLAVGGNITVYATGAGYSPIFPTNGDYKKVELGKWYKVEGDSGPVTSYFDWNWNDPNNSPRYTGFPRGATGTAAILSLIKGTKEELEDLNDAYECAWAGIVNAGLHSVKLSFGIGKGGFGKSKGLLKLAAAKPNRTLFKPIALALPNKPDFKKIVSSNTGLKQIVTPEMIVDVLSVSDEKYQLRYFDRDVNQLPQADGSFTVAGQPLIEITVENPDLTGESFNKLKVSRFQNGKLETWLYTHDDVAETWQLSDAQNDSLAEVKETLIPLLSQKLEERTVKTLAGALISKVNTTSQKYPFGWKDVQRVIDPDGEALTESFDYYSDKVADPINYAKLKQHVLSSGYWERFEYDNYGRLTKTVSQYLDVPVGSLEAASRVVETIYADAGQGIDYDTVIETVQGQEVGRRYSRRTLEMSQEILCVTPGAAVGAADNLVTETKFYMESVFAGRVKSVKYPDSTMKMYTYSADQIDPDTGLDIATELTTTVEVGQPNAEETAIVDGTRTTANVDRQGVPLATVVLDIASGKTLSQQLVTNRDEQGRPLSVTFLDGRTETYTYGCCGLETKTDRFGITTTYTVNGTESTETRLGITTKTIQNGLETIIERIGTDSSVIEQSRTLVNEAGQITQITETGNRITTLNEIVDGSGHRVISSVRPDGGTNVRTYYQDGRLLSVTGTAVFPRSYEYGIEVPPGGGASQSFVKEILLDANANPTGEWVKTYTDMIGRRTQVAGADGSLAQSSYRADGKVESFTDPDGVTTLYAYDSLGRQDVVALDVDQNGNIDYAGKDRITRFNRSVATRGGGEVVYRTEREYWPHDSNATPVVLSQVDRDVTGINSWSSSGGRDSQQSVAYGAPGDWTVTSTQPDGSKQIHQYTGGLLIASTAQDAVGGQLGSVTYAYDAHERLISSADARNGTSTIAYFDTDEIQSTTSPVPGGGGGAQTTSLTYDAAGRRNIVTLPDGGQVDYDYYLTGSQKKVSGTRSYTVEYVYDAQGRLTTQTTNPGAAEQQATTWQYDPASGRMTQKTLPGNSVQSYTYTAAGRVQTRNNARAVATTFAYSGGGDVLSLDYSDATPDIVYTLGRGGQIESVAHNGATHSYQFNDFGQVLSESVTGGSLDGVAVTQTYDALRRRSNFTANIGTTSVSQNYSYDANVSRLKTVSQANRVATYNYETNSSLIARIDYHSGGVLKMTDTRVHDQLNRLTSISAASTGTNALNLATAYSYNAANQRTMADLQDGTYWDYTYDTKGHLSTADRHLAGGQLMAAREFSYTYDSLGNRQSAVFGGDGSGGGLHTIGYTQKSGDRNQYDTITNPGVVLTNGSANAAASVTVDGNAAAVRQGDLFAHQTTVNNSGGPVLSSVDIEAIEGANTDNITRKQVVPAASVTQTYDADGNLTFDGYRDFTWNAENRLISIETRNALVPAGAPNYRVEFEYDYSGRRIQQQIFSKVTGNWELVKESAYVYDGWNVVAELSGGVLAQSYLWGLDVTGSRAGAGGVGGLLSIERHITGDASSHYVAYDGNGNVVGLADASTGEMSAQYQYDAFGNTLRMSGVFALRNPYRFSTKHTDGVTGMYDYGLRHYDPVAGRWTSRDPIGERGGFNLYGFVGNDGVNGVDKLGLDKLHSDAVSDKIIQKVTSNLGSQIGTLNDSEVIRRNQSGPGQVSSLTGEVSYPNFIPNPAISNQIDELWAANNFYEQIQRARGEIGSESFATTDAWRILRKRFGNDWVRNRAIYDLLRGETDATFDVRMKGLPGGGPALIDAFAELSVTLLIESAVGGTMLSGRGRLISLCRAPKRGMPAHLQAGQLHEADQLAALGKAKNTYVWRPTQADMDSAAFNVIVGKPKYTPGGLPRGTIFDSVEGGLLEIKGGSSALSSSYQLRLQMFRALTKGEGLTIQTTRPVNQTFADWLLRWGGSTTSPQVIFRP